MVRRVRSAGVIHPRHRQEQTAVPNLIPELVRVGLEDALRSPTGIRRVSTVRLFIDDDKSITAAAALSVSPSNSCSLYDDKSITAAAVTDESESNPSRRALSNFDSASSLLRAAWAVHILMHGRSRSISSPAP
eukprot:CAMPEP_0178599426 /NCGR_PEP_ID=MMETSP0697-20121206/33318_1 /TAXON_ID=265572 /ORGANISM="Extubocellulus spinifer, Strain CCMP396" /LENGTH=132 /DNA_ID=CAMNT_0020237357 /DNA_START=431 /DNA_END=830 /DNA_ORIENTATION=-